MDFMLATDLASRGLDIERVKTVRVCSVVLFVVMDVYKLGLGLGLKLDGRAGARADAEVRG